MRRIQSIIIFNSATAGDFLTSLCWSQFDLPPSLFTLAQSGRMRINNTYFKETTTKIFYNPSLPIELDYSQIFPVENSHYWLNCYTDLADRCVFINYPDSIQQGIMDIYLEKVFDYDIQKMIDRNLPNLHPYVASKTNTDSIVNILNISWLKNIKAWRTNPNLTSIELIDFFDKSKLENIVKQLINQDIQNQENFDTIYNTWISKNSKLLKLFS